jgi:hypothetical protein
MTDDTMDIKHIRETVQLYFDGMYFSDGDKLKKAFHPSAVLTGHFNGGLIQLPIEKWIEMVAATPPPAKNDEVYSMRLVSLDLDEPAAMVKVKDLYMGLWFTDYLSLLKIDNKWLIINKIFYHEPKENNL